VVRGPSSEAVSAGVADTVAYSPAVSAGAADSAAVETLMVTSVPGVQKPLCWVGKRFRDGAVIKGVEAKGCANDTRLATAEPPGRLPSGRPRRRRLPGAASAVVHAFRR
jgi:hypothetical protein